MNTRPRTIRIAFIAAFALLAACAKDPAMDAAMQWGRLAPFPVAKREIHVEVLGSMFSREFRIQFSASKKIISRWLGECPGIADAQASKDGDESVYTIKPGGGAQFAEVRVNDSTGVVDVHVSWGPPG